MVSGYTATISISQGKTFTFSVGSFKAGTFTANDGALTCNHDITINGTAFTSTSATFIINGDFNFTSGTFSHNSGSVIFQHGTQSGARVISSSSNVITVSFYKVEFSAPDSDTQFNLVNLTMEVNNQLKISGSHQIFLNTPTSSVIKAKGDVLSINSALVGGGTATIEVTGTSNQAINDTSGSNPSGKLPNMKINKSGGTLTLQGNIGIGGSTKWEYAAGTVSAGTSKVMCYYSNTLKNSSGGTMSFYDLEIMGLGDEDKIDGTIQVTHIFTTSYKGLCVINAAGGGGTLELQGDVHWYNENTTSFGNVAFKFTGSNSQALSDSIEPVFYNMEINKSVAQ